MVKIIWEKNGTIVPMQFLQTLHRVASKKGRELFTGYSQNDICEFLQFMIECMHESICRKVTIQITGEPKNNVDKMAIESYQMLKTIYANEYSEIMEMCYGIYVTNILETQTKKTLSIKSEHFFILDLQLFNEQKSYTTIYECFDAFSNMEYMSDGNAWLNEKTGEKQNIFKMNVFWNFPNILVLCLKRFSPDGKRKLQHLVDFPIEGLNLCKYVKGYKSNTYIYDLYGVCNHMGGVQGGHYTACVKHMNGDWLHMNDTLCQKIQNPSEIVSTYAYCLFYRKR
jgi:ubiquitin C-terminal hydrolase